MKILATPSTIFIVLFALRPDKLITTSTSCLCQTLARHVKAVWQKHCPAANVPFDHRSRPTLRVFTKASVSSSASDPSSFRLEGHTSGRTTSRGEDQQLEVLRLGRQRRRSQHQSRQTQGFQPRPPTVWVLSHSTVCLAEIGKVGLSSSRPPLLAQVHHMSDAVEERRSNPP